MTATAQTVLPVEIQTAPGGWEPATLTTRAGRLLARTPDGRVFADPHPDKVREAPEAVAS